MKDYIRQLQGACEAQKDGNQDLSTALYRAHQQITERFERERELEELEERIFQRVMRQIRIQVDNQAAPAIKDLKRDIEKMFQR